MNYLEVLFYWGDITINKCITIPGILVLSLMPILICINQDEKSCLILPHLNFTLRNSMWSPSVFFIWMKTKFILLILFLNSIIRISDSYIWCYLVNICFNCLVIFINIHKVANLLSIFYCDLVPIFTLRFCLRLIYICCHVPTTSTYIDL